MPDKKKKSRERAVEMMRERAANNGLKNQAQRDAWNSGFKGTQPTRPSQNNRNTQPSNSSTPSQNSPQTPQRSPQRQGSNGPTLTQVRERRNLVTTKRNEGRGTPSASDQTARRTGRYRTERRQQQSYVNTPQRRVTYDRNKTTVGQRISDTLKGSGKQFIGGKMASIGTAAQFAEPTARGIQNTDYREPVNRYSLRSREEAEQREADSLINIGVKEGRDLRTFKGRDYSGQNKSLQDFIKEADDMIASGSRDIERAKDGAGAIARVAIDMGANASQMVGDMLENSILPGLGIVSLMTRAAGTASYEARQEGMDVNQQMAYAAGTGLIEGLSEGIFNSVTAFHAAYGKGALSLADKINMRGAATNIVQNYLKSDLGRSLALQFSRLGAGMLEEGTEEIVAGLAEPALKYALTHSGDDFSLAGMGRAAISDPKDLAYSFLVGALMGGLGGVTTIAGDVRSDMALANQAAIDGENYVRNVQDLIARGKVQGREGARKTNSEVLAEQIQGQMDSGETIQPSQVRMLQRALGESTTANERSFFRRRNEQYEQAVSEGRADTVQSMGTSEERTAFNQGLSETEKRNVEAAKEALGESGQETSTSAVALGKAMTGSANTYEVDTILADPKAREAAEDLLGEKLPAKNAEARTQLENRIAMNEMFNRDEILTEAQRNIRKNMSQRGGAVFDANYDNAVETIGVRNAAEIYESFFSRLYIDGTIEGSDFNDSYDRIIAPLKEDFGEELGGRIAQVFNREFAQKVFMAGQASLAGARAKSEGIRVARSASEKPADFTYETEARKKISDRQADLLKKFAERANVHIRLVNSIAGGSANGMYDPESGVIMIAADSTNKIITVAKHELTHHIKATSPELYQKLEDFVLKKWYDSDREAMERRVFEYQKKYNGSVELAREELIADASEAFFTDKGAIDDVMSFSQKLGKAIHDGIKTLLDNFLDIQDTDNRKYRGYGDFLKDIDILKEAESMWLEALEEGRTRNRGDSAELTEFLEENGLEKINEPKHSLKEEDEDGNALTEEQKKFFANSKAVDSSGRLVPVYHTTERGGFTVFDPQFSDDKRSLFFASNFDVSQTYGRYADKPVNVGINEFKSWDDFVEYANKKNLPDWDSNKSLAENLKATVSPNERANSNTKTISFEEWIKRKSKHTPFDVSVSVPKPSGGFYKLFSDSPSGLLKDLNEVMRSSGRGYYGVYLNLENPLIVDGRGQSWRTIPFNKDAERDNPIRTKTIKRMEEEAEFIVDYIGIEWGEFDDDFEGGNYRSLDFVLKGRKWSETSSSFEDWEETKEFTVDEQRLAESNEDEAGAVLTYDLYEYWTEELGLSDDYYDEIMNQADDIDGNVDYSPLTANQEEAPDYITSEGYKLDYAEIFEEINDEEGENFSPYEGLNHGNYNTREISKIANESGYDGVIIRNITDIGGYSKLRKGASPYSDIYIAFNSNQVKLTSNENPTADSDIRYSRKEADQAYMDAVNKGDMETAQRMVDEAAREHGYDIKAYHGTGQKFTRFDRSKQGSNYEGYLQYGNGFYFATSEKGAKTWGNFGKQYGGDDVMSVYLKADRMLDVTQEAPDWAKHYLMENGYNEYEATFATSNSDRFLKTLLEAMNMTNQEVQDLLISKGYDGIKELYRHGTGQLVVFYPVQIKSADPVTYDDNGDAIPLSKRFTEMTDDIRYSIKDKNDIEKLGAAVTDGGTVTRFSLKSWGETDIENLRNQLIDAGFDKDTVDKWIDDVNSTAAILMANELDYKADRTHNALKPNSEYYFTLDLSTLCSKRRLYQGTFNAIMHRLKNAALLPKDLIHLRALMSENYEVPCGICYEESRKKNEPKFANQWLNGYETKKTTWPGYANMEHDDPYIPTLDDVLTTDGRSWLRANHPDVLEAYLTFQKGRGSANPKVSLLHTDYRNDILRMTPSQVENVKHIGGLRIQSFSDFELPHVLDMMQAVLDMSAMGLTSQAYTKVPAFAEIFGGTGIKINLSLIGQAVNGKLVFDGKEGIDPEEAFRLRKKYSKNVGTIIVGANPESVLLAWADPRVDMVIPFHRSGWSNAEFKALGLNGYEDFQKYQTERYILSQEEADTLNEKEKPKKKYKAGDTITLAKAHTNKFSDSKEELYSIDYWDGNLSGTENAKVYLKKCAELHRRPVFYELLKDNRDGTWSLKDDGSTDGYWKSLIDFKMYDNNGKYAEQETVKPLFNMTAAKELIDAYEGDPDVLPVADDVVDQFVKDYKGGRKYKLVDDKKKAKASLPKIDKNTKFSLKDLDNDTSTTASQNTITKLEEKVKDLKAEFKRTNLKTADQKQTRIQAGRLIARHGSNMQVQTNLVNTFNDIFKLYKEKGTDAFDEVYEMAKVAAVDVVNNISLIHDEGAEEYKAIKQYLRETSIEISDDMKRNITDYNDFRKRYFGKLKLVNGETSNIDNVYMELMELFPEQFTDEYTNPADQLYHIVDVLDNFAPYYETLDGASPEMQDYVVEIASDIMETAYNLQTKKTFADKKYEEKVRAVKKAREKALASRNKALDRQKQRYERKIDDLKQKNKDYKAKVKENAEKKRRIMQIADIHKRLSDMLLKPSDNKHLPDGYAQTVSRVLGLFDFTTKGMEKWAERNGRLSNRYKAFKALKEQLEEMGRMEQENGKPSPVEFDDELIRGVRYLYDAFSNDLAEGTDRRLADMTSEELKHIKRLFEAFEYQVKMENKAFDENNKKATSEAAHTVFKELDEEKKNKWKLGLMGRMFTSNFNPSDFFELIGGEIGSLYNATRLAFDKYVDRLDSARTFIQDRVSNRTADKWANSVRTFTTSAGEEIKLTDTQLMSLYCLSKREQAQGHMYYGGIVSAPVQVKKKLTPAKLEKARVIPTQKDVASWLSQLTPEQIALADSIQEYFVDVVADWGNETSLRMFNYRKFNEKNYFPIQSSSDFMASNFDMRGNDPVLKNIGPSKATVTGANNAIVVDDIFTVFSKHVAQMASYNAYVPAITDFQKVWNYTEGNDNDMVKSRFARTYGDKTAEYVENFFKDLNGVYKKNFDAGVFDKGLGLFKKAAVGGNIRVLVQQPTAIARAALLVNPAYLTAAVPLATAQPKKTYRDMMEHCPIARWKTWGFYSSDITSASRDLKNIMIGKDALTDKIFMNMYGTADNVTWTVIFKACELKVEAQNKGLEKGSDEYWEKVNELASRVFDRTQVVDSPFHRSMIMKSQDKGIKMVTAFMAEPTKTINMLNTELTLAGRELKAGHPAKAAGIFTRVATVITANAALLAVAQAAVDALRHVGGDDDKDKGDYKERFVNYWRDDFADNLNPLGMIPYIKDVKSIWDGYDVARMDMNGVTKVVKATQYLIKYYQDPSGTKYTEAEEWRNFALTAFYAAGIPISNAKRDIEGAILSTAEALGYNELFFEQAKRKYQVNDKTKSMWADMYWEASNRNETKLAKDIHDYLIKNGLTEDYIEGRMKSKKKENRSEQEQNAFDNSIQKLEGSAVWRDASNDDKDYYSGIIEKIAVGIEDTQTGYVTNKAKSGLTNEDVILYKLALKKVDKPNDNGNLGTYTKDEKSEALKYIGRTLTEEQKKILMG